MDDESLLREVYWGSGIWIGVWLYIGVLVNDYKFCTISPTIWFIQCIVLFTFWATKTWACFWFWSELKTVWYYSSHFFIFPVYFCGNFNLIMEVFRLLSNTWRYSTKNRLGINRFHRSHGNSGKSWRIHVTKKEHIILKYKHITANNHGYLRQKQLKDTTCKVKSKARLNSTSRLLVLWIGNLEDKGVFRYIFG